ncbi:MAG: lysostaphin resistance A-like protein [Anaerolineae bacterium]
MDSEQAVAADNSATSVPWTLGDMLRAILLFGLLLMTAIIVAILLQLYRTRATSPPSPYLGGLFLLVLEAAMIIPVWLFTLRKYRCGWADLGLRPFQRGRAFGLMAGYFALAFLINGTWAAIASLLDWQVQPNVLPFFGGGVGGLAIALLAGGVVAPLVEELFFRGFLFAGLWGRFGFRWATVVSASFFALVHFMPGALIPVFALGIFFCLLYSQTGSLWPSVIMHGIMNTLALLAAFLLQTMGGAPGSQALAALTHLLAPL